MGFIPNPLASRSLADGGAAMCWGSFPHDATTAGGHGYGATTARARRSKQRPEIYLRDVWGHPYLAVMAMGIESDVSPRNPSLLYSFVSFFILLPRTFFILLPRTRSAVLDGL
jgi:hypothetical protein